ncbi:hypothetical protein BASA50_000195 [Batrachochytrium salamandrivorans]|uniref:Uncharacterized protein n=1 Tax=Batrachochytrium salamandrivorans TaxID=1357716 RepID=A0ABQ8EUZ5_9FUNG|nr:hypothetical protein BASA50_000195 [Batrachochytrium salamandrivorans]
MRFSVITLPICLIGVISANPHPTGGSESVSKSESCGNGLDCESNGMYSNSGEKAKVPKGDSPNYKETTKGLFKLSDIKRRIDVVPEYPPKPKEVLHRSFRLSVIKDKMDVVPRYFPDYKEPTQNPSKSSDIKARMDVFPGYPPKPKGVLHRSFRLFLIKDKMDVVPRYFPDYKEPTQNPSKSSDIKGRIDVFPEHFPNYKEPSQDPSKSSDIKARMDVFPGYQPKPKGVLQKSFKLFLIKKRLGTPKGDDFSSDRSLELESTSSELFSQDPNAQEDGKVDPTTSSDMFEEFLLPDFLVFDYPSAPTRDQQMIAYDIFLSIYNYTSHSELVYTFGKIYKPESKKNEQENMLNRFKQGRG